ncbi:hypothetical protein TNCV_3713581 [Trichonephila clavipes]|nr:hypothetical protein TNCV_3713581 [Trichonephila clavipes]
MGETPESSCLTLKFVSFLKRMAERKTYCRKLSKKTRTAEKWKFVVTLDDVWLCLSERSKERIIGTNFRGDRECLLRIRFCITAAGWNFDLRSGCWVALFRRAFKDTDPHYSSHVPCHHLLSSMQCFTNTELADMHLIYGLTVDNV